MFDEGLIVTSKMGNAGWILPAKYLLKPTTKIAAPRYAVDKWSRFEIIDAAEHLKIPYRY